MQSKHFKYRYLNFILIINTVIYVKIQIIKVRLSWILFNGVNVVTSIESFWYFLILTSAIHFFLRKSKAISILCHSLEAGFFLASLIILAAVRNVWNGVETGWSGTLKTDLTDNTGASIRQCLNLHSFLILTLSLVACLTFGKLLKYPELQIFQL